MKHLIVFLSIVGFISCQNGRHKLAPKSWHEYKNDSLKLSIFYPETFQALENINGNVAVGFFEQTGDTLTDRLKEYLMVYYEQFPVEMSPEDYVKAGKLQIKLLDSNIVFTNEETREINGKKCWTYNYEVQKDTTIKIYLKNYLFPMGNKGVTLAGICLKENAGHYVPLFDSMVNTFVLKD